MPLHNLSLSIHHLAGVNDPTLPYPSPLTRFLPPIYQTPYRLLSGPVKQAPHADSPAAYARSSTRR